MDRSEMDAMAPRSCDLAIAIRREMPPDYDGVECVNRLAFGQEDEARLVSDLRRGGFVQVSLVAEHRGAIVGHILFSDLSIVTGTGIVPALSLAPMAVLPEFQRRGIGSALVQRGLEVCHEQGHRIVIVLGHPDFYPHFGFASKLARPLASSFSGEAWMALELTPGALDAVSGRVEYAPPFGLG
jgi:putative acetyltransferase